MKKSQPGLERKLGRQRKGRKESGAEESQQQEREGGQEFGFHLNHYSENGLAKFSKDFFVTKSNSSCSVLNRTCLLL